MLRKSIVLCVLCLALSLTGCAGISTTSTGTGITNEQAKAGAEYLEQSVAKLQAALDAVKATGDSAKVATAQSVLDQAKNAAEAFKATIPDASQNQYDFARGLVSAGFNLLAPIALNALLM